LTVELKDLKKKERLEAIKANEELK